MSLLTLANQLLFNSNKKHWEKCRDKCRCNCLTCRADEFYSLNSLVSTAAEEYWGSAGAGLLFVCFDDQTALLLKRGPNVEQPGTWGIAGGALEHHESDSLQAAKREAIEELGSIPNLNSLVDTVVFKDGKFNYTSYIYNISSDEKKSWFPTVKLNWENSEARWFPLTALPANLHFGVDFIKKVLKQKNIDPFNDPQDSFDWLRFGLKSINKYLPSETISDVNDLLSSAPSLARNADDETKLHQIEFFKKINTVLNTALKHLIRNRNLEAAVVLRDFIHKVKLSANHLNEYDQREKSNLQNAPKRERAQHSGVLYHGTTLADAVSILKNKTFNKGSAFDRLSLTSDISIAMKFGDTIFAFDAALFQRKGASKIEYFDLKQMKDYEKSTGKFPSEDERKGAKINDIYDYEKEWYVWLPFKFNDADLIKMILVESNYKSEYRKQPNMMQAKQLLENITNAPIEIIHEVSWAQHGLETSPESDLNAGDLKFAVFSAIQAANEFMALGRKLIAEERKQLKKRYPDDNEQMIDYVLKNNSWVYSLVNNCYREIQQLADKRSHSSLYDGASTDKYFNNLEHIYNSTKWDDSRLLIAAPLKPILEKLIAQRVNVNKGYADTFMTNEDQYLNAVSSYNTSDMVPYRKQIMAWVMSNLNTFITYVRELNIKPNDLMEKTGAIRSIVADIPNITLLPDDILRCVPDGVLDNKKFEVLGRDRIISVFQHNPYLADYSFKWKRFRTTGIQAEYCNIIADLFYKFHPEKKPSDEDDAKEKAEELARQEQHKQYEEYRTEQSKVAQTSLTKRNIHEFASYLLAQNSN